MITILAQAARFGRAILVLGLAVGIALPELASSMKPWLAEMVAVLLFIAALRVGPRQALGAVGELGLSAGFAALCQVALPIIVILLLLAAQWGGPLATGIILMAAAPPVSGSPNLAILVGSDPTPALRQLVVGTALLPLTVVPVFWLVPALGGIGDVLSAAGQLLLVIVIAAGAGFLIRGLVLKSPKPETLRAIDGVSALAMAVVVVGLMSAVGPAFRTDPQALALSLLLAFASNFALQVAVWAWLRRKGRKDLAVPLAIVAGNRNVALFLAALPASVTDPLLLFIGCYQVPMYLTPIMLGRLYGSVRRSSMAR